MDFSTLHDALQVNNNSMLDEAIEEIHFEVLENIMGKLFTSMHSANEAQKV